MNTLLSTLFVPLAQNGRSGFPSWVIFLILLVLLVAIIWFLTRPKKEAAETASPEAAPEEKIAAVAATAVETEAAQPEPEPEAEAVPEPEPEAVPEPEPAPEPEPEPAKPDDLKKIEGIGPKIEGILNAAGITTYTQLADTSVTNLDKIVRQDAGITIAHPSTWPKQAQMAADGQWDKLAAYQDKLHGGRQIKNRHAAHPPEVIFSPVLTAGLF